MKSAVYTATTRIHVCTFHGSRKYLIYKLQEGLLEIPQGGVEPRLMTTLLIRPPHYYRNFILG